MNKSSENTQPFFKWMMHIQRSLIMTAKLILKKKSTIVNYDKETVKTFRLLTTKGETAVHHSTVTHSYTVKTKIKALNTFLSSESVKCPNVLFKLHHASHQMCIWTVVFAPLGEVWGSVPCLRAKSGCWVKSNHFTF